MKKLLYLFTIISSLLIFQCSNEIPTSNIDNEYGKISLKIDKTNAPENVVLVEAFLTRTEHDTVYGQLNILDSTSADIIFEEIATGEWHLRVDAKDIDGIVLYTGETDISILAGILTQVNLTLVPTGNGYGSIYIVVNWGVNTSWTDYPGNPIISQYIVPDYPAGVTYSKLLFEDGIYKMWFNSLYNSAVSNVWYAVSNDGINWQLGSNFPVLSRGNYYDWDSRRAGPGVVIKDGNEYKMYYLGFADPEGSWHIGLATSTDGINWSKYPTPIIYASSNEIKIIPEDIIKINNEYFLYYTSRNYPYYDIRLAVSQDGINFIKLSNNPLLTPQANWEGTGIYGASIIFENNQYKMVYANVNSSGTGLGLAYSPDGINWVRESNNPFFTINDVSNNWCSRLTYPFWRKINNQYKIYYTGIVEEPYNFKIGMIYK